MRYIGFPFRLLLAIMWAVTVLPVGIILCSHKPDDDIIDFILLRGRFASDYDDGGY